MMKAAMPDGVAPLENPTNQVKYEKYLCPYCKKTVYHPDNECLRLDKIKKSDLLGVRSNRMSWGQP